MATGALDANGIWQYGEDDSEITFSALLNKLASSTSTTIGTKPYGLARVVPTSVNVGSGSYTVSTNGAVTVNGASTISLNGVFTSQYRNYRIVANLASNSFSRGQIRFRNAGSDRTNANYWYNCVETYTGAGTVTVTSGEAVTGIDILYFDSPYQNATMIDIFSPMISGIPKHAHIRHSRRYSGGASQMTITGGFDNTATSDGFTWYGSTWTGTIEVFAYNG